MTYRFLRRAHHALRGGCHITWWQDDRKQKQKWSQMNALGTNCDYCERYILVRRAAGKRQFFAPSCQASGLHLKECRADCFSSTSASHEAGLSINAGIRKQFAVAKPVRSVYRRCALTDSPSPRHPEGPACLRLHVASVRRASWIRKCFTTPDKGQDVGINDLGGFRPSPLPGRWPLA